MNTANLKTFLGELSPEQFLAEYWQKKPLLIRQAVPDLQSPISPEELAGMALEPDANVRLIQEKHPERPWHVSYAPLDENVFSTLPESHWTFLVTDCEKHWPDLHSLVEPFRFIPDWRIDDLMISYAADQGSVGPHIDEYDVFLLQLHGQRCWQIHDEPLVDECYIDGIELKILQSFTPDQTWTVNPGDLLYLPPRVAHHGTGVGDGCMTASVGFRAPDQEGLLQGFLDECLQGQDGFSRYSDPDLKTQPHPAEIRPESLDELWALLQSAMELSTEERNQWLGRHLTDIQTQPESENQDSDDFNSFIGELREGGELERSGFSRMGYTQSADSVELFANGNSWTLPISTLKDAQTICDYEVFSLGVLQTPETMKPVLHELYLCEALDWA